MRMYHSGGGGGAGVGGGLLIVLALTFLPFIFMYSRLLGAGFGTRTIFSLLRIFFLKLVQKFHYHHFGSGDDYLVDAQSGDWGFA